MNNLKNILLFICAIFAFSFYVVAITEMEENKQLQDKLDRHNSYPSWYLEAYTKCTTKDQVPDIFKQDCLTMEIKLHGKEIK